MWQKRYGELRDALEGFLVEHLSGLENAERTEALIWYCRGLGMEIRHKTVLGIAKKLAADEVQSVRQRMQRGLQKGNFSHEDIFERVQQTVFKQAAASIQAYCIDDTGFEKKGELSVGVQRQYSGTLGQVGNCQVAVSCHGVGNDFSSCLAMQLYLPKSWTDDQERCARAEIPSGMEFQTKPEIALKLLEKAVANGAPKRPIIADAGYGESRAFRDGLTELGLEYAVAIPSTLKVWPPNATPQRPSQVGKRGRRSRLERDPNGLEPLSVHDLAQQCWEQGAFRSYTWRDGSKGPLSAEFCMIRVQSAEGRRRRKAAGDPVWLLMERDEHQKTSFRYYLSSLPQTSDLEQLVHLVKLRWRIERDYQDMKQTLGLDAYEGRYWGGFHRHLAMVALMHAFLSLYRESFSPWAYKQSMDLGRLPTGSTRSALPVAWPLPVLQTGLH